MPSNLPEYVLLITPEAQDDFDSILSYTIDKWGDKQAVIYRGKLDSGFQQILSMPRIGMKRDDLFKGCRSLHVERHTIFYRVEKQSVQIIRIFHDSRDFPTLFTL